VILDATFGNPTERAHIRQLARRLGAPLRVLVCRADDALLTARLAARATERGVVSDARLEQWPQLRAAFNDPNELDGVLDIDAAVTPEHMEDQALALLRDRRNA
jgi:predicted kinase